jgi:transcriptional regulator with PAS, ATPase and Fis domain
MCLTFFYHLLGSSIEGISLEALTFLKSLSWPGNIRQLENTIERAINICSGNIIEINDVSTNTVHKSHEKPIDIGMEKVQKDEIPIKSLDEIEKEVIEKALTLSEGNITQAAKLLKVSRNTIYNKIKRYEVHLNNC